LLSSGRAGVADLSAAAVKAGRERARRDGAIAQVLAEVADLRPEGFALLHRRRLDPDALAALLQAISGAPYPPATQSVTALARTLEPATLAGAWLMPAGRLGPGLLVVREPSAMAPPTPARPGAIWDNRFRLTADAVALPDATLGPLGSDASRLRGLSCLPAAVLRTLPAVRVGKALLAVPHLHYPDRKACECFPVLYSPSRPVAAASFGFGDA
jgi:tRNA(Ile)-lysidine synthase